MAEAKRGNPVEEAAIAWVLAYEIAQGREPRDTRYRGAPAGIESQSRITVVGLLLGLGSLVPDGHGEPVSIPYWPKEFRSPEEESPWWLLNFYLELPFYMPYLDTARFNVSLPYDRWVDPIPDGVPPVPFVLLHLIQRVAPPPRDPSRAMQAVLQDLVHTRGAAAIRSAFDGNVQPIPPPLHLVTIVEAITPKVLLQSEVDARLPHHPSTYLERCLSAFNLWVRSIIVTTKLDSVRPITRENLPMWLPFFHQLPGDGRIVLYDLLLAHENPPVSPNTIATKAGSENIRRTASSIDDSHGLFKAGEWYQTAFRLAGIEGRYDLAIIALNTAVELLVFGLARVLLVDDGRTIAEIDEQVGERLSVASVCHRFIEPKVGGRWDVTDLSCPVGEVAARIIDVRNKVAHQGLSVSPVQIYLAQASFHNFTDFLISQVGRKRWKFQRSFMDLVNTFGAAGKTPISAKFSKASTDLLDTCPRYWLPADDDRQAAPPPAFVAASPGTLPPTVRPEKAAEWEAAGEPFMHLVMRQASPREPNGTDPA